MRRAAIILVLVCLGFGFAGQAYAAPVQWGVVYPQSRLGFTGTQMGLPFKGRFETFTASIFFDPETVQGAVEVFILISSINTENEDRDAAVQGPDWFDSANNPRARFVAKQFRKIGERTYEAKGRLTLRKTTRDVILPFALTFKDDFVKMHGELKIDRVNYGVGTGDWASGSTVGREVIILIDLVAKRKTTQAKPDAAPDVSGAPEQ